MSGSRIIWMDFIRGLFILLVIFGHWMMMIPLDIINSNKIYSILLEVRNFFFPYRMEILFFLSGLIVIKSIKKESKIYFKGKIENLIYPYLIWGGVYLFLFCINDFISGDYIEIPIYLFRIIMGNADIVWFLYFLFWFFLVIKKVRNLNLINVLIGNSFLYLFFSFYNLYEILGIGVNKFSNIFYYFYFFYIADQLNLRKFEILTLCKKKYFIFISIISVILTTYINFVFKMNDKSILYLIPVLLSIPFFILVSDIISRKFHFLNNFLNHFSKYSIVYYLSHFSIIAIFLEICKRLNFTSSIIYPSALILMILIPYLYILLSKKYTKLLILFKPLVK